MLRPEAGAEDRRQLTAAQVEAGDRLVRLLEEVVASVGQPSPSDQLPANRRFKLDLRRSRVAFLSAERGAGKSTVLFSLAKDLSVGRGAAGGGEEPAGDSPKGSEVARWWTGDSRQDQKLASRLIWLEPMDMERMPKGANLLAAVLVRIQAACQQVFQAPRLGMADPRVAEPMQQIDRLARDVALAWDGDHDQRRAKVPPDVAASEVLRAERARQLLTDRLDRALNELAAELGRASHLLHDPVFVLPVDDFDSSPTRCRELARFLRLVSVPRLFSIIVGDESATRMIFQLDQLGELRKTAGGDVERQSPLVSPRSAGLNCAAGAIAGNSLRKLIPPGQRVAMGSPSIDYALRHFRPLAVAESEPKLIGLLGEVWVPISSRLVGGKKVCRLSDLFSVKEGQAPPYAAARLFRAPMRVLVDLYHLLWKLVGRLRVLEAKAAEADPEVSHFAEYPAYNREVVRFIARVASLAVAEDPYLSHNDREAVLAYISRLAHLEWQASGWEVEFGYSLGGRRRVSTIGKSRKSELVVSQFLPQVYVHRKWEYMTRVSFGPYDPQPNEDSRSAADATDRSRGFRHRTMVDERTIGALTWLRDAISTGWGETGPRLVAKRDCLVWCQWDTVQVPWPFPRWATFWEMEAFLFGWREYLDNDAKTATQDQIARHYLALSALIALGEWGPKDGANAALVSCRSVAKRFTSLKALVKRLCKGSEDLDEFVGYYLVVVGVLACQESGLSSQERKRMGGLADQMVESPSGARILRERVRRYRARSLELFFEEEFEEGEVKDIFGSSETNGQGGEDPFNPRPAHWRRAKRRAKRTIAQRDKKRQD
jgi:hypothetical protein